MGRHCQEQLATHQQGHGHASGSASVGRRRNANRGRSVINGLTGVAALTASLGLVAALTAGPNTQDAADAADPVAVYNAGQAAKAPQTSTAERRSNRQAPTSAVPSPRSKAPSQRTTTAPSPAPRVTPSPAPQPAAPPTQSTVPTPEAATPDSSRAGGALPTVQAIAAAPSSGAPWNRLLAAAKTRDGGPDLADQDSKHAAETLAAALVYAKTGDTAQRDYVVSVLRSLPKASLSGARVLSVGRQLGGYAQAADVIGYRDAAFTSWIGSMRTKDLGGHGRWTAISQTSEDSASNWGAWAMATRISISSYLGDKADLERAAAVFRGFTGERASYAGFRKTNDFDPTWACGGQQWVPINPASCGGRGGAIVEDISRSSGSYPSVDDTGLTYSWEVLGGATMSAHILEQAGYADVWTWGDKALLRAAQFLEENGGYPVQYTVNQYIPHMINNAYEVNLGPVREAGYGRQFGFTDWLR